MGIQCESIGNLWDVFMQYGARDLEEEYWQLDVPVGEVVLGCEPTLTWWFDEVADIPQTQKIYDERIGVDITWLDENGQEQLFRGYWYAASTAFIVQRLEKQDPYYRRFIQISQTFNREQLEYRLEVERKYLAGLAPNKRFFYLQHHFEFEGQAMLYER